MTVRFLSAYGKYKANDIDTFTSAVETALINASLATANLTGGTQYVAPLVPNQLISANLSVNKDGYITGLVDKDGNDALFQRDKNARNIYSPVTLAGTYTGNGTTQAVNCGFRPSLVIVKGNTAQHAVYVNEANFMKRTDHFLNVASIEGQFGITITDTGFTVGSDNKVNGNAIAYFYFAYCDNGSDNLLQGNWQGNAVSGRTVDLFKRKAIAGLIAKRDSARAAVWVVGDAASNYWFDGSLNAVSADTTLASDTGVLTVGGGVEINQWAGLLGEGVNCLAFAKDSDAVAVKTYIGTGTARNVTLPWEADAFLIATRDVSSPTTRGWFSSLSAGQAMPLTNQVIGTGDFTVSGSRIAFSGAGMNANNIEYVIYAFRRLRYNTYVPQNLLPNTIRKQVEVASTGYIDCGTSNSLQISGAITMEWYGSVYAPDQVQYAGTADIDTLAGNQDKLTPLIFRSGGVDGAASNVSFGMAVSAGQVSVDTYSDLCILIATQSNWGLLQSNASGDLDNHPMNTGITVPANTPVHIIATHAGAGVWTVYVNGAPIKERKRNLAQNVVGFSGHRTVIMGRQRDTIANTNGGMFKLARIYNRALTQSEAFENYLSVFGKSTATDGFVEQWVADNASGATLVATVNSANNGTITNGVMI